MEKTFAQRLFARELTLADVKTIDYALWFVANELPKYDQTTVPVELLPVPEMVKSLDIALA